MGINYIQQKILHFQKQIQQFDHTTSKLSMSLLEIPVQYLFCVHCNFIRKREARLASREVSFQL